MANVITRIVRQEEIAPWIPVLAGGSLIAYGLGTRSKKGAAAALVGGGIIWAGTRISGQAGYEAHKTVTVNAPPEALYQYWRRLENLPSILQHLESVQQMDSRRSRWIGKSPAGFAVQWDTEITQDEPDQRIAWTSVPDADACSEGSVEFTPGPRGTQVKVYLRCQKAMVSELDQDLRRFKQLMETGEIITTTGQPSGR